MYNVIWLDVYGSSVNYETYTGLVSLVRDVFSAHYNTLDEASRSINEYGFYYYKLGVI